CGRRWQRTAGRSSWSATTNGSSPTSGCTAGCGCPAGVSTRAERRNFGARTPGAATVDLTAGACVKGVASMGIQPDTSPYGGQTVTGPGWPNVEEETLAAAAASYEALAAKITDGIVPQQHSQLMSLVDKWEG